MKYAFTRSSLLAAALAAACLSAFAQSPARKAAAASSASAPSRLRGGASAAAAVASQSDPTSPPQAMHAGRLSPAEESRSIAEQMKGIHAVAGTDVQAGYRIEQARGWYEFQKGILSWRDPLPRETNYLMISVQDAGDKRVLPGCKVAASLTDAQGKEIVSSTVLTLRWDPQFYHYGANIALPKDAKEPTLQVRIDPPDFARTDKALGAFFLQPVTTSWSKAEISGRLEPGQAPPETAEMPAKGAFLDGRHPPIEPTPYPGAKR